MKWPHSGPRWLVKDKNTELPQGALPVNPCTLPKLKLNVPWIALKVHWRRHQVCRNAQLCQGIRESQKHRGNAKPAKPKTPTRKWLASRKCNGSHLHSPLRLWRGCNQEPHNQPKVTQGDKAHYAVKGGQQDKLGQACCAKQHDGGLAACITHTPCLCQRTTSEASTATTPASTLVMARRLEAMLPRLDKTRLSHFRASLLAQLVAATTNKCVRRASFAATKWHT